MVNGILIATSPVSLSLPGFEHIKRMAVEDGVPDSHAGWGETDEDAIRQLLTIL